jgi:ATP-dependent Clp protease, protease subunit
MGGQIADARVTPRQLRIGYFQSAFERDYPWCCPRQIAPGAQVLLHQPWGQAGGQATDVELAAKEILRMRTLLEEILAKHTGQPVERINKDTDRDFVMSAEEAQEYGILDEVIEARTLADMSGAIRRAS